MKSKRSLMTVLVGLAMLATPIAAAAKDHGRFAQNNSRASRSYIAPARNFGPVNKHQFRNSQAWVPAPAAVARHEWKGNGWKGRGWGGDGDADDYQNYGYGNPGYVAAPVYAAP